MELKDSNPSRPRSHDILQQNPLHGVESIHDTTSLNVSISQGIHYMELKVIRVLRDLKRRAERVSQRRIHYMELKANTCYCCIWIFWI